jgi:hypothetical protein
MRIHTDLVGEIICTLDHRWLVVRDKYRKWVKATDLRSSDLIVAMGVPWKVDKSREAGWLAGLFDGEGTLYGNHVTVAQREGVVLDHARAILRARDFEFGDQPNVAGESSLGKNDCTRLRINGGIGERLRLLGSIRPLRLLEKSQIAWDGSSTWSKLARNAVIEGVEYIGKGPVVSIQTSSRTFLAEGLLSHNCDFKKTCQLDFREGTTALSDSIGVARSQKIRPDYDPEFAKLTVRARWQKPKQEAE